MTQEQLAVLRTNLIGAGLAVSSTSDDEIIRIATQMHASGPAGQEQLSSMMAPGLPWLTILGLGAGALAIYLVWSHYRTNKLGEIERPEPPDARHQLRGFSKSLGKFASGPSSRSLAACRARTKRRRSLGDADYEFEPEIRLEGHRGSSRKGARR